MASTRKDARATTCAECTQSRARASVPSRGALPYTPWRRSAATTLRLEWTGDREADRLISEDPTALLIGFCLDQQVPIEWAFQGPLRMRERLGTIDPRRGRAHGPRQGREGVPDAAGAAPFPGEHGATRVRRSARPSPTSTAVIPPRSGRRRRTRRSCSGGSGAARLRSRQGADHGRRGRQAPRCQAARDGRRSLPTGRPSPTCAPSRNASSTRRKARLQGGDAGRGRRQGDAKRRRTRKRPPRRWRVAGAEVTVLEDGGVRIVKIGPMGPYGNNAYVVRDVAAGAATARRHAAR